MRGWQANERHTCVLPVVLGLCPKLKYPLLCRGIIIGVAIISVSNDVFSDIGVFLFSDVADVVVDDRSQQGAALYLAVRRYQLGDTSVVEPEAEDAYPVFLFLRFFAFAPFSSACRYLCSVLYGGDKIVVATYICVYLGMGHPYIFADVRIGAGKGRDAAVLGKDDCFSVGFGRFARIKGLDEVEFLHEAHVHVLETHQAGTGHAERMSWTQYASEEVDYLDELAASHAAYAENAKIESIRHDDQYVTGILRIVFYSSYDAEIAVTGIILYSIPRLTAFVAVVVGYHESIEAQGHEFVNEFPDGNP